MNKDLGKIYREQLENHTPAPPEETWHIIARRMHKRTLWRKAVYGTAVLAGIGLIAGLVFHKPNTRQATDVPSPAAENTVTSSRTINTKPLAETNVALTMQQNLNAVTNDVPPSSSTPQVTEQTRSYVPIALPGNTIQTAKTIEMPSVIEPMTNIATDPVSDIVEKNTVTEKANIAEDTSSSVSPWLETEKLKIPNAFTPNDVINNIFKPASAEVSDYEMYIYNRFGGKVFHSKQIEHGWDGTYNGSNSPTGTYVYIVIYTDRKGIRHEQKGQVHLIR